MGGCLTGKTPRRQQRGASLLTQKKVVTNLQYINYLLVLIQSNPHLTLLLHKKVFEDLKRIFLSNYWPEDKETSLIRLLEDYIKYSVIEVSQQKTEKKPYDLLYFGEFYGKQMHKLQNQVKMKSHWMIDSLQFEEQFRNYNFSLEDTKQILKLTNDVKYLCSKEMLSIFYLSSYFVVCCEKMEKEGKSVKEILQALKKQVVMLKDQYGVKGMKKKQQAYINREDQSKQIKNIEEINIQIVPITFKLQCQNGLTKEQVLENKIMDMVQFAKQSIDFFNELIHSPCIQSEGFGFKSNLKLYNRENKLALHRIKEKLLKKLVDQKAKSRNKNQSIEESQSIKQLIQNQKKYLSNLMKQIYQKLDEIPFTVTDLLRGKCLFNKVSHINRAVLAIKKKISAQEEKGVNVKLIEIENRLQKITKDLVLKIKIQDLVCQFQLVLFFNQAENQIHHKMYELCRSKLLSEITLLYQWNKKSTKAYFSLLYKVIDSIKEKEKTQIQEKKQRLQQFLNLNKQDLKDRERLEQSRKIKDLQVVNLSKNIKVEKQKVDQISQGIKLRSLQYFIELKQQDLALEMFSLPQIQCNNQYIKSCQLNCLGGIHKNKSQYSEALECYFKSLELKQNAKGRQSIDCAQILNNIGIVYVNLKKYDDALEYYRQSLFIKKKLKGANSYECAQTLCNIGSVYDNMEKYQQALDYYDQSLSIKQDVKGRDSIECAQILNNIGLVYLKKGQEANAIDFLSRSLTVKQKTTGKDSMDCAQTLNNLGALYKKIKKYQEALDFFGRSLAIKQKIKGKQSLDCAQILNNIGSVYQNMGKHEESISYFTRSLEINEKIKGKESKQYQKIYNIITIMLSKCTSPKNLPLNDVTNNLKEAKEGNNEKEDKEKEAKETKNQVHDKDTEIQEKKTFNKRIK